MSKILSFTRKCPPPPPPAPLAARVAELEDELGEVQANADDMEAEILRLQARVRELEGELREERANADDMAAEIRRLRAPRVA